MDYFTRALSIYGETFPKNTIVVFLKFLRGVFHLLAGVYLPFVKWKKIPDERDLEHMYLWEQRGMALAHPDPKRYYIEKFYCARKFTKINITNNEILINSRMFLVFTFFMAQYFIQHQQ